MKKRRSAEQIVGLPRQADVDLGKGATVPDVCRRAGSASRRTTAGVRSSRAWIRRWPKSFRSSWRR